MSPQPVHIVPDGYVVALLRARVGAAQTSATWVARPPPGSYLLYITAGAVDLTMAGGGIMSFAASSLVSLRAFVIDKLSASDINQARELDYQTPATSAGSAGIVGIPVTIAAGEEIIVVLTSTGGQDYAGTLALFPASLGSVAVTPRVA